MVLQFNTDTENPAIKSIARKHGPHAKRATIMLPMNEDGTVVKDEVEVDEFEAITGEDV